MLKITVEENPATVSMKLEGKLAGPWVSECHRTWQSLQPNAASKALLVDLNEVTHVDSEGQRLLSWIHQQGAQFRADSPLPRYFADQARKPESRKSYN